MVACPSCTFKNSDASKFCSACGAALSSDGELTLAYRSCGNSDEATDSTQSDASHHGRFLPGTRIANRYRIVSLIGKGGMGEVYRADDLKLGQTVALKFLTRDLAWNQQRLDYFHREVRLTRQISHPNVCRVYDIGEVDGQHFLSMEYVDGEDLRVLLRRIGRVPKDKGVQIAHQMCAALSAAHDKGVLHRDLKPANVMIDGRGQVRITDFGLAKLADEGEDGEIAGTPAYMAPEQLRQGQTTIQSDLYSLGLVLFELFTGEAVNKPASITELVNRQEGWSPSLPSSLVNDMDPVVERAILQCLEHAPYERPKTARVVAVGLPGSDPLAAALSEGETPSPEIVATAGGVGTLDVRVGSAMLVAVALGLAAVWLLSGKVSMVNRVALEKHPEVLAGDARRIIKALGYEERPNDTAWGYNLDVDYLRSDEGADQRPKRWDHLATLQPPLFYFWYRQSPIPLKSKEFFTESGAFNLGKVGFNDPPLLISGMINLRLDPKGRLIEFRAVPPQIVESPPAKVAEVDWPKIFEDNFEESLGFSLRALTDAESTWTPPTAYDARTAWEGAYPNGIPIRVEAASYRGTPVYFQVIGQWTRAEREKGAEQIGGISGLLWIVLLISAILAAYNMRHCKGDPRGAFRLAVFIFSGGLLLYLCGADHLPSIAELELLMRAAAWSIFGAAMMWVFYIAFEPFVRRFWPQVLISWSRLLHGRFTDPLIGQHLLIGVLVGVLLSLVMASKFLTAEWLGRPPSPDSFAFVSLQPILSTRWFTARLIAEIFKGVLSGLFVLSLLLILRIIFMRKSLAAVAFVVLPAILFLGQPLHEIAFVAVVSSICVVVMIRFGLLSYIVAIFVFFVLQWPMTTDTSAWYFDSTAFVLLVCLAIAGYGFYASLGKKPAFGDASTEPVSA